MKDEICYPILVIDDNPAIHEDFKKILLTTDTDSALDSVEDLLFNNNASARNEPKEKVSTLPNLQIDSAFDGQEGVQLLKKGLEKGLRYAVAFVDIRMPPGWDGIKTITKLWELDPDIQMVICSAYSDYTWQEIANLLGENEKLLVLKKPFDIIEVRQMVASLTKKWTLTKEINTRVSDLHNIVEQKTTESATYLSLVKTTLESTTDAIIIFDKDNRLVDCNNKFVQLWDLPLSLIKSDTFDDLLANLAGKTKNADKLIKLVIDTQKDSSAELFDIIELNNDNTLECYSRPQYLADEIAGRVWRFRNITEHLELQSRLAYQATHDHLTGLANRYLLLDRLMLAIEFAKRKKTLCGIIFIDIDRFKTINDTLGHEIGDQLLIEFSQRLQNAVRKTDMVSRMGSIEAEGSNAIVEANDKRDDDTIARMGGDEFVIILNEMKSKDNCISIYNRMLTALNQPIVIGKHSLEITSSLGVSIYPENGLNKTELLKNADIAMYRSKRAGGNQMQFYSEKMNEDIEKRFQLELALKKAIQNNEFILEYQPEVNLQTGKIVAVEALIRWQHPRLGLVPPLSFIPIAEEIGFISSIGDWVMNTASNQGKAWEKQGNIPINIAINLSPQEFCQHDIVAKIQNALSEAGLSPERMEIEITEAIIIENYELVIDKMKKLKDIGVKFVIDDFGTGYSSLSYLSRIPLDKIKIDRSFISMLSEDVESKKNKDHIIIDAIISIAHKMGFPVLAEGIESKFQLDYLREHNCTEGQGFYLYHPMLATEIDVLLRNNGK